MYVIVYTYSIVEENNPLKYGGGGEKTLFILDHLGKWEVELNFLKFASIASHALRETLYTMTWLSSI